MAVLTPNTTCKIIDKISKIIIVIIISALYISDIIIAATNVSTVSKITKPPNLKYYHKKQWI